MKSPPFLCMCDMFFGFAKANPEKAMKSKNDSQRNGIKNGLTGRMTWGQKSKLPKTVFQQPKRTVPLLLGPFYLAFQKKNNGQFGGYFLTAA